VGVGRLLESVGREAMSFSALVDNYCTTPGRMKSLVASMARDTRVLVTGRGRGLPGDCALAEGYEETRDSSLAVRP
jgi:hypothetical protein